MAYSNKQMVQSFYWLGTDKNFECTSASCCSGICDCPDEDQVKLSLLLYDSGQNVDLTLKKIPIFKWEYEICEKQDKTSVYYQPLIELQMTVDEIEDCLKNVPDSDDEECKNLMKSVPVMLAMNRCCYINKRDAVACFCLNSDLGENILEKILYIILRDALYKYISGESVTEIYDFIKSFWNKLSEIYKAQEETKKDFDEKVKDRYAYLEKRAEDIDDMLGKLYKNLYKDWLKSGKYKRDEEKEIHEYLQKRYKGWMNLINYLYFIKEVLRACGEDVTEFNNFLSLRFASFKLPGKVRLFPDILKDIQALDSSKKEMAVKKVLDMIVRGNIDRDIIEKMDVRNNIENI